MEALFFGEVLHGGISWKRPSEEACFPYLAEVPNPRSRHGRRHPLSAILALVCWAIMSGAKSSAAIGPWGQNQDIALRHRLGFTRTPPKARGIPKVLIALDVKAFEAALTQWAEANLSQPIPPRPASREALALDGKSVRGSFDGLEQAVHLLSLMAHKSGRTFAQTAVPKDIAEGCRRATATGFPENRVFFCPQGPSVPLLTQPAP